MAAPKPADVLIPFDPAVTDLEPRVYGPHCAHADLCSMFGCDQRGHIDYPCRQQATCTFCGPGATCPMDDTLSAIDCPDCHMGT